MISDGERQAFALRSRGGAAAVVARGTRAIVVRDQEGERAGYGQDIEDAGENSGGEGEEENRCATKKKKKIHRREVDVANTPLGAESYTGQRTEALAPPVTIARENSRGEVMISRQVSRRHGAITSSTRSRDGMISGGLRPPRIRFPQAEAGHGVGTLRRRFNRRAGLAQGGANESVIAVVGRRSQVQGGAEEIVDVDVFHRVN